MINNIFKDDNYEIIIKKNCLYIKNYINIVDINLTKIAIELEDIKINVTGRELIIFKMDKFDIGIKGIIKGIDFINEK
jgi:hypothetical protein